MTPYDTEEVEFDNYQEWQIAIGDAKVDRIFVSAWISGKKYFLKVYLMKG